MLTLSNRKSFSPNSLNLIKTRRKGFGLRFFNSSAAKDNPTSTTSPPRLPLLDLPIKLPQEPRKEEEKKKKKKKKKKNDILILSYHWDTAVPTQSNLDYANKFFLFRPPKILYSSEKFRTVEQGSTVPEVVFLGRSNVGKSSLLNAVMGRNICHTSSKPGRTRTMNFFAVGGPDETGSPGRIVILDMPGYGKGSRAEWGQEITKYLVGRKQLRRAFLLVDSLHGLKSSDQQLLASLRQNAISHQILLSKVDRIFHPNLNKSKNDSDRLLKLCEELRPKLQPGKLDGPEALGELIGCSGEKTLENGQKLGVDRVRWAILAAAGLGGDNNRRKTLSIDIAEDENYHARHASHDHQQHHDADISAGKIG